MKNTSLITVFTPTYNRAYIISNLYESLKRQTNKNFEWLIVDDGSTDNTEELVRSFIGENKICIRYYKQENGGKHRAINKGVALALGELFFIVDSDDCLAENAVEKILFHYESIKNDVEFAGVCGCRSYFSGEKIGTKACYTILDCSSLDFAYKYKMNGDMAEIFKTEILKQYVFPEIKGEIFIAESIVWNRIAINYKFRYFNENIYLGEYLEDGLTKKSIQLRKKNPIGATLLYSELVKMPIPLIQKIKANINFWRFAKFLNEDFLYKWKKVNSILSFIGLPISLIFIWGEKNEKNY